MTQQETKLEKLTENAKEVLANSYSTAKEMGSREVLLEHVFISLLSCDKGLAARFLRSLGVDIEKTIQGVKIKTPKSKIAYREISVSSKVKDLIKTAYLLAHEFGHVYIGTEHILLALLQDKDLKFVKELENAGLDYKTMMDKLFNYATYAPGIFIKGKREEQRGGEALNYFGRNLNQYAKEGKLMPIVGRDKEIDRLIRILSRQTKNNPILVGDAGVGKTAIIEGLVERIVDGQVPYSIRGLEIYQIDIASIVAGSKVRGDIEQRLLTLISEVASSPNKVLFIDEIHMIIGAGAAGPDRTMDIANILKPRLTDGSIRVIGATTVAEYRQYFEEDAALSRRFQPIMVEEIGVDDAIKILKELKPRIEEYHGVKISKEAIQTAAKLSDRYISDRLLPDKAIDVLDEAAAAQKLEKEEINKDFSKMKLELTSLKAQKNKALERKSFEEALKLKEEQGELEQKIKKEDKRRHEHTERGEYKVTEEDIKNVISEWTGIPISTVTVNEQKSLRGITRKIYRQIVGQKDAVNRVTATLKRARLGISDERRPLASFLFLGPTGVGKTEMAKVVAREFFGTEKALIQVDMSEYMEPHSVAKIIGAPPGYVGYQEGGQLTEKVRKRPYSVVLFDEIEKAHPDFLNILLQILEEGHITDSKGRSVSFKNVIIIMTTNIGAEDIGKDKVLGFRVSEDLSLVESAFDKMRERLTSELKKVLKPEFINRIDEVVIFRGLNKENAISIVKLGVKELEKRLKEKDIQLEIDEPVIELISEQGFSEEYGARNIRRKIQELIENPLSDLLLEDVAQGFTVKINREGNKLKLTKAD